MSARQALAWTRCLQQLQKCSTVIPVTYASWLSFSSVVEISKVRFFDEEARSTAPSCSTTSRRSPRSASARQGARSCYNQGMKTRKVVVFKPAPPLTKSVMRVPYGIDGSSYDLCASVVNRFRASNGSAFESLVTATLRLETDEVEGG